MAEGSIAGRVTNLSGGFHGGTVKLGQGSCASSGFKTTSINSTGYYEFTGLPAGTFCVTVDTSSIPADGRALFVAVAVVELLRASWAELAIARALPPLPAPPAEMSTLTAGWRRWKASAAGCR